MTVETLEQANELTDKCKRLNDQLHVALRVKDAANVIGIVAPNENIRAVLEDLPVEARYAAMAVIINALETELARAVNELAKL